MIHAACTRCVLPAAYPGADLDADGVCSSCRSYQPSALPRDASLLETVLGELSKVRGREYDVLVCASGGKDSTYALDLLHRHSDLRVLAWTFDNGFLSEVTQANIARVTQNLGIDQVTTVMPKDDLALFLRTAIRELAPLFGNTIFSRSILEFGAVHYTTGTLYMNGAVRHARNARIPWLVTGFTPVQDTAQYGASAGGAADSARKVAEGAGSRSAQSSGETFLKSTWPLRRLFVKALGEETVNRYLVDIGEPVIVDPQLLRVFDYMAYDLDALRERIAAIGWRPPEDTGVGSTNDRLNPLSNYLYAKTFGYARQAIQLAGYVRRGWMTRDAALVELAVPEPLDQIRATIEELGMNPAEIIDPKA